MLMFNVFEVVCMAPDDLYESDPAKVDIRQMRREVRGQGLPCTSTPGWHCHRCPYVSTENKTIEVGEDDNF